MKHLLSGTFVAGIALTAAGQTLAQDAAAGARVFKSQCAVCHSAVQGRTLSGPSLFGVVGRPAGMAPGFTYSRAMKSAGLTWDAATLDRYVTSPATVVPHAMMIYPGLKDARQRADLIAYLATLH
jgi:cytochrome c